MSNNEKPSLKEKKQRQSAKRKKQTLIGIIALVVVVVLVVGSILLVQTTGAMLRSTKAASTTNQQIDKAVMTYYFNDYLTDYVVERLYYIQNGYLELDLGKSLKKQTYDGEHTWYSYFAGKAETNLKRDMLFVEAANAAGITLDAEETAAVEKKLESINPRKYGTGLNKDDIRKCLTMNALANKYLASVTDHLNGSEDEWLARYNENEDTYATVDYKFVNMELSITSKEDQEAYDAALNKAMDSKSPQEFDDNVQKILVQWGGMEPEEAQKEVDNDMQYSQSYVEGGNDLLDWLFSKGKYDGSDPNYPGADLYSTYVEETTSGVCRVYMLTRLPGRDTTKTVTYRNILLANNRFDSKEEAYAKADEILAQWKANGSTPEAFVALAAQNSADSISAKTNYQYADVFYGRMDDTVNDWAFDPARKPGDVGTVLASDGVQVLYYEGIGVERWQLRIRQNMYDERYAALLEELTQKYAYSMESLVLDDISPKIAY